MITKPPPLNKDFNTDPNIQALKRKGGGILLRVYIMYNIVEARGGGVLEIWGLGVRADDLGFQGLGYRIQD